jgi:Gas vesicle synthesis protein GvpO
MPQTRESVRRGRGAVDTDHRAAVEQSRPAGRTSQPGSDGRLARSRRSGAEDTAPPRSQAPRPRRAAEKTAEPGIRAGAGEAGAPQAGERAGKVRAPGAGERARRPSAALHAASRAAAQVSKLTGRDPESVISVAREDTDWQVEVEVVEMYRIPDSADIVAVYQVELDHDGEMVKCRRQRRYIRGSTEAVR